MAAEHKAMWARARIHIGQVKEELQLLPVGQVEMEAVLRGQLHAALFGDALAKLHQSRTSRMMPGAPK